MKELEKKLDAAMKLHAELNEIQRSLAMKNGMFNDLMADIATNHLGYPKDTKEFPLPELMLRVYNRRDH